MFEERLFRPFDLDRGIEFFFRDARLLVAGNSDVFVDLNQTMTITESDLTSCNFVLEISRDEAGFRDLMDGLSADLATWGDTKAVALAAVASSSYLKLAEIIRVIPVEELARTIDFSDGAVAEPFLATFHGCDLNVFLVLLEEEERRSAEPWRKGTWLTRGRFGLRTSIEGFGYSIQPLTDEIRDERGLPNKCMRFIDVPISPLDVIAGAGGNVDVYVDAELLAGLERESSRPWAIAFTDQLALDFLTAIVISAVSADEFADVEWDDVSGTLLGSVMELVAKTSDPVTLQVQLVLLRDQPNHYLAQIEGAIDMRANAKRLPVS